MRFLVGLTATAILLGASVSLLAGQTPNVGLTIVGLLSAAWTAGSGITRA